MKTINVIKLKHNLYLAKFGGQYEVRRKAKIEFENPIVIEAFPELDQLEAQQVFK